MSRKVAEKFRVHVLEALADRTYYVGRNLTLDARFTKPSDGDGSVSRGRAAADESLGGLPDAEANTPATPVMMVGLPSALLLVAALLRRVFADLVNRDFTACAANRVLVGDITYLPIADGYGESEPPVP